MRRVMLLVAALSALGVLLFSARTMAADGVDEKPVAPLWERIVSDDTNAANAAAAEYRELQQNVVYALVQELNDYDKSELRQIDNAKHLQFRRIAALIRLLGDTRSDAAAPALAEFLCFSGNYGFSATMMHPPSSDYTENAKECPAVGALIQIGKPVWPEGY